MANVRLEAALREALLEAVAQVRVGDSNIHEHARLQAWHRSIIALLGTPDPGEFVMSDYWIRLTAPDPASARQSGDLTDVALATDPGATE